MSWLRDRVNELEAETTKLVTERKILLRAAKLFRRGNGLVNRVPFVADHCNTLEVKRMGE